MTLTVDGRRIEVAEIEGDPVRRSVVLLHEGLGSVGLWRDFPEALAAGTGRRVIAYSRLGHGRSDPPARSRARDSFFEEAEAVLPALLHALGAEAPLLVGHSDGASIALVHAGRHPVAGIALMAPHVIVEDVTLEGIREARDAYVSGELRERLARHHDDPDATFYGWCDLWLDPSFRDWSLEAEAERVDCPVLLIQGEDDAYGTLDQLDRIQSRVRGPVERRVVPGGHSPHLEAREPVLAALVGWADALP